MKYTGNVGTKFNQDGSVRAFPGNTVICMVNPGSATYKALLAARKIVENGLGDVGRFSYLPELSYHMTVFDCVCDRERRIEDWTSHLSLDAPLGQVDAMLKERYSRITTPAPFKMKYGRLAVGRWITVMLSPATPAEEARLRGFRDELSGLFCIHQPGHETYPFHITLAYGIVEIGKADAPTIEKTRAKADAYLQKHFGVFDAGSPALTFFNDMFVFPTTRE